MRALADKEPSTLGPDIAQIMIRSFPTRLRRITVRDALTKLEDIGQDHGNYESLLSDGYPVPWTLDELKKATYYHGKEAQQIAPIRFLGGHQSSYKFVTGSFLHLAMDRFLAHLVHVYTHCDLAVFMEEFQKVLRLDENYI